MTIFALSIDDHAGHFGESEAAERAVICRVLGDIMQAIGSGRPLIGEQKIELPGAGFSGRKVIGAYWFAEGSHSFAAQGKAGNLITAEMVTPPKLPKLPEPTASAGR